MKGMTRGEDGWGDEADVGRDDDEGEKTEEGGP